MGREAKLPSKGCKAVADDLGLVYMTKGNNTCGFWRYSPASDSWAQMADVPLGTSNKKVKGGADLAFYEKDGERSIYLVKGQKTNELWRYKISGDSWLPLQAVPVDLPAFKTDAGSWLELVEEATDGHPYLYLHKAKFHHLHRYDLVADQWVTGRRTGMPLVGRSGKSKKSKDGGSAAFWNGDIYALKGGNTCEFWRYRPASDSWLELPAIPEIEPDGKKKRVKGGGDVVNVGGGGFFVTKGNKTTTSWRIVVASAKAQAQAQARNGSAGTVTTLTAPARLSIAPNPLRSGFVTVGLGTRSELSDNSVMSLRMYDALGRAIGSWLLPIGCSSFPLDLRSMQAGVYMVKLSTGTAVVTQKLVIQR
jgi:hypothetical protein